MPEYSLRSALPSGFSVQTLEMNLEVIANYQPKLVERISWPVDGSHVRHTENGEAFYRLHDYEYPLWLSNPESIIDFEDPEPGNDDIFFFGIGLGEHINYFAKTFPDRKIVAWDRNPWIVRLFLMREDYSEQMASGNLRLYMCGDLVNLIPRIGGCNTVWHPLLKKIYRNEVDLVLSGTGGRRIMINTGGLFVDDVADAFKELGFAPFYLDLNGVSIEEIEYAIIQIMPELVFSVNYMNGLSEMCKKYSRPLLCWEVDPMLDVPQLLREKNEEAYMYCFRKKNVPVFNNAGFEHVQYLPLAVHTGNRNPVSLSKEEKTVYSCPVSFVGSSMSDQAEKHLQTLYESYKEYQHVGSTSFDSACDPFEEILRIQSTDYSTYQIPGLAADILGDFLDFFNQKSGSLIDPVMLLSEAAAARKRLAYLSAFREMDVKVWGDKGWKIIEGHGVTYEGPAGHKIEINKIYSGTRVNLDINRIYQMDMVNMRVFDIMACGGFVLAEYSEELENLFEVGKEVIAYKTLDELIEKTRYYLEHPDEVAQIALSGMTAVRERHTIRKRLEHMLGVMDRND